jgi:hypothetical protein
MGNLPALLPNATPLVSRFFAEMSMKRQRCVVVNLENNSTSSRFFKLFLDSVIMHLLTLYPNILLPGMCSLGSHLHSSNEACIMYSLVVVMMLFMFALNCLLSSDIRFVKLPLKHQYTQVV